MSGTTAGAIKAIVEAGGLSLPVYRTRPASGQHMPYAYVTEGIADAIEPSGDFGSGRVEHREEVQLDVVQAWKDANGVMVEVPGLADSVAGLLHGKALPNVRTGRVYPARVTAVRRLSHGENNVVRDTISIVLLRAPGVAP